MQIAQPALSRQIRALEDELGTELIDRYKHPLRLTAAGAELVEDARSIINQADRALERARTAARGERGILSVATLPWGYSATVPRILYAFCRKAPHIRLELSSHVGADLARALTIRTVDIGFERVPILTRALQAQALLEEQLVAAVGQQHPLAQHPEVTLEQLADEPFVAIAPERVPGLANLTEQLAQRGLLPPITHRAPHPVAQLTLIAAGIGIGLHIAPAGHRSERGVAFIPIQQAPRISPLTIMWRRDDKREHLRLFLDTARETTESLGIAPHHEDATEDLDDWFRIP